MTAPMGVAPALEVEGLSGRFHARGGSTPVLHDVSFTLGRGEITAVVGETGSGKSLTALTVLGLTPPSFETTAGAVRFEGRDLLEVGEAEMRRIRGGRIAMVFQDARSALNPVIPIGAQLADVCRRHQGHGRRAARAEVAAALGRVRIPEARRRARQYPHEFSGGMAQRVMIALALIAQPDVLILDEPTTGLDVTIQADIMALIIDLVRGDGLTACLITHDLGVVAETCDRVVVMRDGRVEERGTTEAIFTRPGQPYTQELLAASRLGERARA